jgi:hypothetical protein
MAGDYNLSITGATIRRPDTVETARLYLELGDWKEVRRRVVEDNVYQLNSEASLKRFVADIIKRLRTLTDDELRFLVSSHSDDQSAMLWVSVCRTYPFVSRLSATVLRDGYEQGIPTYTEGAFEAYFEQEAEMHPELLGLSLRSHKKVRTQIFRMMVECGLIQKDGTVTPIHPSPAFVRTIDAEHKGDLDLFPGVTLR